MYNVLQYCLKTNFLNCYLYHIFFIKYNIFAYKDNTINLHNFKITFIYLYTLTYVYCIDIYMCIALTSVLVYNKPHIL